MPHHAVDRSGESRWFDVQLTPDSTKGDLEPSEAANMPLGVNGSTTPARQHLHAPPMLNTTSVVGQLLLSL